MTYLPHSTLFLTSTRRQHRFTAGSMERNGASDISPSESLGFRKRIESIRVLKKGHNLSTTTSATGHFHMVTVESNYRELAITYSPCPPLLPNMDQQTFTFLMREIFFWISRSCHQKIALPPINEFHSQYQSQ